MTVVLGRSRLRLLWGCVREIKTDCCVREVKTDCCVREIKTDCCVREVKTVTAVGLR